MSDLDNVNRLKVVDHVSRTLSKTIMDAEVGKNTTGAEQRIKENINSTLKQFHNQGLIHNQEAPDVKVDILWNSWTLKQKAKWFLTNKICPWIAKDTRDLHTIQDLNILELYANWVDAEHPFAEPSVYRSDMPEWAIINPKSIVISDITIRPIQSLDFITVNIEVGD